MEREIAIEVARKIKKIIMANIRKHKGGLDYKKIQEEIVKLLEDDVEM